MGGNRTSWYRGRPGACVRLAALGAFLLLGLWGATPQVVEARSGGHPLYDDGNTLRWYSSLREARTVAAQEGKLILVDVSLEDCRTCKMVIELIADRSIAARLSRLAIGYHVNARGGTPLARDFRGNLRSSAYLPWVGFFTPGQSWVTGFAPSQRVTQSEMRRRFLRAIRSAEAEQRAAGTRRSIATSGVTPNPATPASARPVAAAPQPTSRPASGPPARSASPSRSGGLVWYRRIAEAQAAARAEGKIIFISSTKPGCSLCVKLKNKIVPQVERRLGQGAVGYYYDITRPESSRVDAIVRANLKGAYQMPLAGFVTPDLAWLHGFFGSTTAQKLTADYETAMRQRRGGARR